jgi:4a-hydroxytetrahydrobiopterin dehydratase
MTSTTVNALPETEIQERLKTLPEWRYTGKAIERQYEGDTYLGAVEALNRIARLSEEADHHPDLTLSWKRMTISYNTHTANGVTELDFTLAAKVDDTLKS